MKYLICSDIHGSESACKKIINHFNNLSCDRILLLGDTLYHGPRNPLPPGHNPKAVAEALNEISDKIIACRGNCDAEVDQMVLKFQTMADYVQLVDEGITLFCTHGHVYAPVLSNGSIPTGCETASKKILVNSPAVCFYGHTHVTVLEKNQEGIVVCNPGSTSLPKGGTLPGFAVYENRCVKLFDIEGNQIKELSF